MKIHPPYPTHPLEWWHQDQWVPYEEAITRMETRVGQIITHTAGEALWFLEHPPLYTLGTSARAFDVLRQDVPSYETGRGGQVTYHGPGQRVVYLMLDLRTRTQDLKAYVATLEAWLIRSLKELGVEAVRRKGRVGLWVVHRQGHEEKIAAIGIRVKKWVTLHGIALNVMPDLTYYQGIVPCGLSQFGVTSLQALGVNATMAEVDEILKREYHTFF